MKEKNMDDKSKVKEMKMTIRELKNEIQHDRSQQKSQSSFAMLSEQNGISITAISLTELESLKTSIHELKREVDENKSLASKLNEENTQLKINLEQATHDYE